MTDVTPGELAREVRLINLQVDLKESKELHNRDVREIRELHDRDIKDMKEDFADLRSSYRKLVNVAVGEAFALLIAIVLIAVQLALTLGAPQP